MSCLVPGCTKDTWSRGLCSGHYNQANQLVRSEITTWEVLVKNGRALEIKGLSKQDLSKSKEFFLDDTQRIQD